VFGFAVLICLAISHGEGNDLSRSLLGELGRPIVARDTQPLNLHSSQTLLRLKSSCSSGDASDISCTWSGLTNCLVIQTVPDSCSAEPEAEAERDAKSRQ
jgi:hypothetical protein